MQESIRKAYLEAMDIQVWVRRDQPVVERPEAVQSDHHRTPPEIVEAQPVAQALIEPIAKAPASRQGKTQFNEEQLNWNELQQAVSQCRLCELRKGCTQTVFGVGNPQAELMIIGEAPGADEDRQGEPFVGRAGQLLNEMLLAIGFTREQVFIANILKCRPPGNRDPKVEEAAACQPYLQRQLALISPKVILSVGRISAQNLLKTDKAVGRMRGVVHAYGEQSTPLVVTYHPAYLLRSSEQKGRAWADLQLVLQTLKQAG